MRYAPEHNEVTRDRILDAAGRLFQEHGIDAMGLAKVMAEADLTVGTFYTHFKSKEALVREVMVRSIQARHEAFTRALRDGHLEGVARTYLSPSHRDAPATGCPAAALTSEVARRPRTTRQAFAANMEPTLDAFAECISKRRGKKASRADASAVFGLLAGTLQLARATPNREESDAILEAGVRAALLLAK